MQASDPSSGDLRGRPTAGHQDAGGASCGRLRGKVVSKAQSSRGTPSPQAAPRYRCGDLNSAGTLETSSVPALHGLPRAGLQKVPASVVELERKNSMQINKTHRTRLTLFSGVRFHLGFISSGISWYKALTDFLGGPSWGGLHVAPRLSLGDTARPGPGP